VLENFDSHLAVPTVDKLPFYDDLFAPVNKGIKVAAILMMEFDPSFGLVLGYAVPQDGAVAPSLVPSDAAVNPAAGI
jgi:hypothetical protein